MLAFDAERGLIEVESGIQWPQLLEYLTKQHGREPKHWTFSQKQAGADRIISSAARSRPTSTAAGSPSRPSSATSSRSAGQRDGPATSCSRTEGPGALRLAIGGYGLFGFVYSVTLRLVPRQELERVVEVRDVDGVMQRLRRAHRRGLTFGDFQFSIDERSEDFLRRGVFSCYRPVADDMPLRAGAEAN